MKTKRIICIMLTVTVVILLVVILTSVTPIKTGDRQKTYALSKSLKTMVSDNTKGMNLEQIIDYSLKLTSSLLQFSYHNDLDNGKANCIGYAQMCSAVCNQGLTVNGLDGEARDVVGYIESIDINWCDVLKSVAPKDSYKNFVKDHDFVELVTDSRTYYFDPSIYDVLGMKCLTIKTRQ